MRNQEDTGVPSSGSAPRLTDAWVRASGHLFDSIVEANRAVLATVGFEEVTEESAEAVDAVEREEIEGDWAVERSVRALDGPSVGDTVRFTKTVTDADVASFAQVSGDTNPLHLDDEFAGRSRFAGRIVHGTLVSGLVSAALARLPGLVIYLSQDVQFLEPVRPDTTLTAVVEVVEDEGDDRFRVTTDVYDADGQQVLDGQAVVLVDEDDRAGPG